MISYIRIRLKYVDEIWWESWMYWMSWDEWVFWLMATAGCLDGWVATLCNASVMCNRQTLQNDTSLLSSLSIEHNHNHHHWIELMAFNQFWTIFVAIICFNLIERSKMWVWYWGWMIRHRSTWPFDYFLLLFRFQFNRKIMTL